MKTITRTQLNKLIKEEVSKMKVNEGNTRMLMGGKKIATDLKDDLRKLAKAIAARYEISELEAYHALSEAYQFLISYYKE
jgi:hypothetical protein